MAIEHDANGNSYITINNIRVTWVHREKGEKDWSDSRAYLRIQAYRGDPNESLSLYPGAELPIVSEREILTLIGAISELTLAESS